MILLPNCQCCGCSGECCREITYGYMDTVPPGKWYDECPEVGNCASGGGAIEGDCAGDVIEGHIIERFCKASIEGSEIRAILRDGSAIDDFGTIAGIDTSESCGVLGRISGDHDITAELEFEDDGAYLLAKVPIRIENAQVGGPMGAAGVVICWCCVDPADPPPDGEVCPCCAGPPPPPPGPCGESCSDIDISEPTPEYSNYRTDPCRIGTYADYKLACGRVAFSFFATGATIASNYPDLGIPEELYGCVFLWLGTQCSTVDFAEGQDTEENCCVVSTYTVVNRVYVYRWIADDCLWRTYTQGKYVETIQNGDPLAIGGCDAEFPAPRECTALCPQSHEAASCCNPLP